jgi:O-methyltransferase involved in polyketide biosynthesis
MSENDAKPLVLHGYSPEGDTWLSFREPNETQIAVLCKRLVEDRYDKPFLVENRKTRSLCFGIDGAVQSEMWLDASREAALRSEGIAQWQSNVQKSFALYLTYSVRAALHDPS